MRNELTQIEYIELYLEGKLNAADHATFEQRMQADAALKESVELQKIIIERIEITALKKLVQKEHSDRYGRGFNLNTWLIVLLICTGLAFAGWGYFRKGDAETVSATREVGATTPVPQAAAIDTAARYKQQQNEQQQQPVKQTIVVQKKKNNNHILTPAVAATTGMDPSMHQPVDTPATKNESPVKPKHVQQFNNGNFTVSFAVYVFNAENGGTFTDKRSGSTITVPAGILTDASGKPVKGSVKLYYREFRDAADMAYSGIPMVYRADAGDFRFNSAGMFELHVLQNKDSLGMRSGKGIRVDFMMTQQIAGTAFYKLDDKKQNWSEIGKIEAFTEHHDTAVVGNELVVEMLDNVSQSEVFVDGDGRIRDTTFKATPVFYTAADKRQSSLLTAGANKGHTYPTLVSGLVCKDFGVYNCDQVYRMGTIVSIRPVFKDTSGNVIGHQDILTMIDLNYNGSFSFDPRDYFQLNPADKNVLLLFTNDNKVYSYTAEDFKKQPLKNGSCTFVMGDITERVKNTDELRAYLGLVK